MFSKNLEYQRLKKGMTKRELAAACALSPQAITNYEKGLRKPDSMDIIKRIAVALDIDESVFLNRWNTDLRMEHGAFRKSSLLTQQEEIFLRLSVEEYCTRFGDILYVLGTNVFPKPPELHALNLSGDIEADALKLRRHLMLSEKGPIHSLVEQLEDRGFIMWMIKVDFEGFSGMNGICNGYPYIALNRSMPTSQLRSTIVHELVHLFFDWSNAGNKEEKLATAIGDAFLLPKADIQRELGMRRSAIQTDMWETGRSYGVSLMILAKRAHDCKIIDSKAYSQFCEDAKIRGWQNQDPFELESEKPHVFEQLVIRAMNEGEISVSRCAELLQISYQEAYKRCECEAVCDDDEVTID